MEVIQFKDEEQLSIEKSFELADVIFNDMYEIFLIFAEHVPNARADFAAYRLCMRFADVMISCGWTVEQLARDMARFAEEEEEPQMPP